MKRNRIKPVHIFLFLLFILLLVLAILSEGTPESGDSYQHYLMARYSFQHPELLLDLWGKPVFTLLSAPFAATGFLGINIFNILCGLLTAWLGYLIAQRLGLRLSWLAVFFTLFAPIYFICLFSGLTEPLFGLILIASIYLAISGKYEWSALLISFLPFVRSEGNGIILLFLLVLLLHRQWKAIPLLAAGTLVYTVAGYFYYDDIYWLINHHPYQGESVYGKGDLLHFIYQLPIIAGSPLALLFLAGIASLVIRLVRFKKKGLHPFFTEEFLLIAGACVLYIAGHSYVHWKGISGSSGTIRVMAAIAPVIGLVALRGLNDLFSLVSFHKVVMYPAMLVVVYFVTASPFRHHEIPLKRFGEEVQLAECSEWMKSQKLADRRIIYFYPYLAYSLGIDPFNWEKRGVLYEHDLNTEKGSIIVWDSHFGPVECGLPIERMMSDTTLKLLRNFRSESWLNAEGKEEYFEVVVFEKQ